MLERAWCGLGAGLAAMDCGAIIEWRCRTAIREEKRINTGWSLFVFVECFCEGDAGVEVLAFCFGEAVGELAEAFDCGEVVLGECEDSFSFVLVVLVVD